MHCILCNVAYAYDNTISLGMDTAAVCVKARHLADQVCSLMDDAELCTSNHAAADKKCEAMPKKNTLTHQKKRNPDLSESKDDFPSGQSMTNHETASFLQLDSIDDASTKLNEVISPYFGMLR